MPLDKLLHFFVGWSISASLVSFINLYAIIPTIILAFLKEIYDYSGRGTPDKNDFLITIFGGILAIITNLILSYILV